MANNGKEDRNEKLKRKHKIALMFNELELEALNMYCKKYKIKNKSKLLRKIIMTEVLRRFDEDYPRLFD